MNRGQRLSGFMVLAAIWAFAIQGTVQEVQAGDFRYVKNSDYIDECGACHLAYPPQLMPTQSWVELVRGLDDHFGENAEVDDELGVTISSYLDTYALGKGKPSRMSKMMRNLPQQLPIRITAFPAFIDAHATVLEQLEMSEFPTGYLSPCADCHRQAASALFDKELLHPGYGPSVWGQK